MHKVCMNLTVGNNALIDVIYDVLDTCCSCKILLHMRLTVDSEQGMKEQVLSFTVSSEAITYCDKSFFESLSIPPLCHLATSDIVSTVCN